MSKYSLFLQSNRRFLYKLNNKPYRKIGIKLRTKLYYQIRTFTILRPYCSAPALNYCHHYYCGSRNGSELQLSNPTGLCSYLLHNSIRQITKTGWHWSRYLQERTTNIAYHSYSNNHRHSLGGMDVKWSCTFSHTFGLTTSSTRFISNGHMPFMCRNIRNDRKFMDYNRHRWRSNVRSWQRNGVSSRVDCRRNYFRSLLRRQSFASQRHHSSCFIIMWCASIQAHPLSDEHLDTRFRACYAYFFHCRNIRYHH